ncbi:MAG: trypsin-like peptidase domain-containing protein [Actinobacteria bacterium]|nr:trypsin-like peptidase domain-containing protein [Actinomycetota bacterium]
MDDTTQTPPPRSDEPAVGGAAVEGPVIPVEFADPFTRPTTPPADPGLAPEPRYVVTRSWAGEPAPIAARPARPEGPSAPSNRSRGGPWKTIGVAVLAALIGAASAFGVFTLLDEDGIGGSPGVTVVERVATEILSPENSGSVAAAVARRVLPSIVTVQVRESDVGAFVADGSGSGVVLSVDGVLVTNQHVVDGAQQVRVVFADGRTYDAEILGEDALTDLAVIRIHASGLTAIELGSTESMSIGDTAIAIGSPLGLEGGPSVTVGVISAFGREVQTGVDERLFGMLQTDAPITRGSSGGALVDSQGRLIAITSAIGISDVGAEGLGFAIPIELVRRITDDIIEFGAARHAFLGVTGSTFFTEASDGATIPAGVAVASVFDDTAAQLAGIEAGDVLVSVDDKPVRTMEQLVTVVRLYRVDEAIDIVVERDGEEITVTVTLMERPEGV